VSDDDGMVRSAIMDSESSKQRTHFRCPLCGSHTFAAVEITLRNGTRLKADFYHCTDCSLHFVHPERFMRAEKDRRERTSAGLKTAFI
jgi:predicted RNA-binding Zn-ribbon protein involved in translation (DUF1610 family)